VACATPRKLQERVGRSVIPSEAPLPGRTLSRKSVKQVGYFVGRDGQI
jgi:hypothetical protein